MSRDELRRILYKIAPVTQLAKLKSRIDEDVICLVKNIPSVSLGNSLCGWETYDIMLITPDESIVRLDNLYNKVHDRLVGVDGLEIVHEGFISEQHDASLEAYYMTMQVRFPSQLR